jgi:galactose mutarotase-like enzyme
MAELSIDTHWTYRGLKAVILGNRLLQVVVLPQVGAKLWQITYKPRAAELLWNNPRIAPSRLPIHSRYDDVWSGGWDELFPNDESAVIEGEQYPDHGELWTGEWSADPFARHDEIGVTLRFTTPISAIHFERTITLRRNSPAVRFQHRLTNTGNTAFPFLWKLHPAFRVTPAHRIDFPPMQVQTEPAFPGTLADAPQQFAWPMLSIGTRTVDLRRVTAPAERALYFLYGTDVAEGWCRLTDTAAEVACTLQFDKSVFPSPWLFASYGGWRNYNVAVLEPCTGYPFNFAAAHAAGRTRILQPGELLETEVLFSVEQTPAGAK